MASADQMEIFAKQEKHHGEVIDEIFKKYQPPKVDTGTPEDFPEQVVDDKTQIFLGRRIELYVDALKTAGYQPEQVTKILVTHKHADHTGELAKFPNAKIYM